MSQYKKNTLITTKEAATLLGYTHDYVSKMCREGKIKGHRLGRTWLIEREGLEDFFVAHELDLEEKRKALSNFRKQEQNISEKEILLNPVTSNNIEFSRDFVQPSLKSDELVNEIHTVKGVKDEKAVSSDPRINSLQVSWGSLSAFALSVIIVFGGYSMVYGAMGSQVFNTLSSVFETVGQSSVVTAPFQSLSHNSVGEETSHNDDQVYAIDVAPVKAFASHLRVASLPLEVEEKIITSKIFLNDQRVRGENFISSLHEEIKNISITDVYLSFGEHMHDAISLVFNSYTNTVQHIGRIAYDSTLVTRDVAQYASNGALAMVQGMSEGVIDLFYGVGDTYTSLVYGFVDVSPKVTSEVLLLPYRAGLALQKGMSDNITQRVAGALENTEISTFANTIAEKTEKITATLTDVAEKTRTVATHVGETSQATVQESNILQSVESVGSSAVATVKKTFSRIGSFFASFLNMQADPVVRITRTALPLPQAVKTSGAVASSPTSVTQNYTNIFQQSGIDTSYVDKSISALHEALLADLARVTAPIITQTNNNVYTTQLINRIEDLTSLTVRDGEWIDGIITGAKIRDSLEFSVSGNGTITGTFNTGTTTVNGDIDITGDATIGGSLSIGTLTVGTLSSSGPLVGPYFHATSTSDTSTFDGPVNFSRLVTASSTTVINATATNATTTNLFATLADITSGTIASLLGTNATVTNATTTNFFSALARATTGIFETLTGTNATFTNATTSSLYLSSLNGPLQANGGMVSATSSIGVLYGGTGLTSAPSYGNILLGNGSGGYSLTATSSLGIAISDTTGTLAINRGGTATTTFLNGAVTFYDSVLGTLSQASTQGGLFFDKTNSRLGIGTAVPTEKLEVNGVVRVGTADDAGMINLGDISTGSGNYTNGIFRGGLGTTAGGGYLNLGAWTGIAFNTSSTWLGSQATRMVIDGTTGNVGIGTTSPFAKFSVHGNNGDTGGTLFAIASSTASATSTYLTVANTGQFNFWPTSSGTAGSGLQFTGAGGVPTISFMFGSNSRGTIGGGAGSGSDIVVTAGSSGNVRLSAGSVIAGIYSNGNFGIGTSTPYAKLSVVGEVVGANFTATTTAVNTFPTALFTNATTTNLHIIGLTTGALATDANGKVYTFATSTWTFASSTLLVDNNTFSGNNIFSGSNAYGTPASITLTNATGLPVSTGISGLGTGVATALAVNVGSAGAFVTFNGALGTPSSGTLTNATGLPLSTGVTGTLPVANGGTGWASIQAGAIPYGNGTGAIATTTQGTGGQVLAWLGGIPTWVATSSINNGVSSLAQTYGSTQTGAITFATSSATSNGQTVGLNITNSSGAFTFTPSLSGTLTVAGGGTGATTFSYGLVASTGGTSALTNIATSSLGLLTTNVAEGSNLYYTDTRVNSYIHASTTIPKTYTANTFTNANTFNSTFTLSTLNGPLHANAGVVTATTSIGVLYGGTGLTSAPAYGNILVGNASGGYTLTATSSLGLPTGTGVTNRVAYWSSASALTSNANLTFNGSTLGTFVIESSGGAFLATGGGQVAVGTTSSFGKFFVSTEEAETVGITVRGIASQTASLQQWQGSGGTVLSVMTAEGRLGVGTSTPYANLSVWGSSSSSGTAFEVVNSASTTLLTVGNTGNVGIGTTTASNILSIEGSADTSVIGSITNPNSGTAAFAEFQVRNGYNQADALRIKVAGSGFTTLGGNVQDAAIIQAGSALLGGLSISSGAGMRFYTGSINENEDLGITSDGLVGIGSTTPYSKLGIAIGTSGTGIAVDAASGYTGNLLDLKVASTTVFSVNQLGALTSTASSASTLPYASTTNISSSGGAWFATGGGNVGIGTTSPQNKLHVYSTTNADGVSTDGTMNPSFTLLSNNVSQAKLGVATADDAFLLGTLTNDVSLQLRNSNSFHVGATGITSYLTVKNGGNVGIGTTTPQWLLNPTSATASQLALSAGAGIAQWAFRNAGGNLYFATTTTAGTATTSTSALTILGSSGNVGIGSTSPVARLSIQADPSEGFSKFIVGSSTETDLIVSSSGSIAINGTSTGSVALTIDGRSSTAYSSGSFGSPDGTMRLFNEDTTDNNFSTILFTTRNSSNTTTNMGSISGVYTARSGATMDLAFQVRGSGTIREAFRIAGSGNIGIGTTTPYSKLGIAIGTSGTGIAVDAASGYTGNLLDLKVASTTVFSVNQLGALTSTASSASTLPYASTTNISSSGGAWFATTGGNVGIGTTTPQMKLHVVGTTGGSIGINTPSMDAATYAAAGTGALSIRVGSVATDNSLMFGVDSSSNNAWIQSSDPGSQTLPLLLNPLGGHIGIGASPTSLLDVNQSGNTAVDLTIQNGQGILKIGNPGTTEHHIWTTGAWPIGIGVSGAIVTNWASTGNNVTTSFGTGGTFVINSADNTVTDLTVGNSQGIVALGASLSSVLHLWTTGAWPLQLGTNSTARMTILNSGYVGIGTTNPQSIFDVVGAARIGGSTSDYSEFGNNGTTNYWSSVTDAASIYTGGSERIRIDTSGNVGIGTTTPNSLLTLQAANSSAVLRVNATNASGDAKISLNDSSGNEYTIGRDTTTGFLDFAGTQTTFSGYKWRVNNGTEVMRITNGGNVGIGTTTPQQKLSVTGSDEDSSRLRISNDAFSGVLRGVDLYQNNSGDFIINNRRTDSSIGAIRFQTNDGSERMAILNGGNIGIATTSPGSRLAIDGSAVGTPTITSFTGSTATAGLRIQRFAGAYYTDLFHTSNSSNVEGFAINVGNGSSASEIARFNANGNVGIGTTTPFARLSVLHDATYNNENTAGLSIANATTPTKQLTFGYDSSLDAGYIQSSHSGVANKALLLNANGGSVGIGTTSPFKLFSVNGAIAQSGGLYYSDVALGFYTPAGNAQTIQAGGMSIGLTYGVTPPSAGLYVSGNVGIGTTTPGSKLVVGGGEIQVDNTSFARTLYSHSGANIWSTGTRSATDYHIYRESGAGNVIIDNGNLGIGTTTPQWLLNPTSATASQLALSAGAGIAQWAFRNAGGNLYVATTTVEGTATSTNTAFTILSSGSVGIGTAIPGTDAVEKLTVYASDAGSVAQVAILGQLDSTRTSLSSSVKSGGGFANFDTTTGNYSSLAFLSKTSNGTVTTFGHIAAVYTDHTNGSVDTDFAFVQRRANTLTESMRILSTGQVGIGTSTPQWLLNPTSATASQLALSAGAGIAQWAFRNAGGNLYVATTTVEGTATTSTSALSVFGANGNVAVANLISCAGVQTNASGVMSCTSDANLKNVQSTFTRGLAEIRELNPVVYQWKSDTSLYDGGVNYTGFLAQEVQQVIPEAVNIGSAGQLQLQQFTLLATAINAIQELDTRTSFISNSSTSTALTVDTLGNIGIGTATPLYKLHVAGDIAGTAFVNISTRESKTGITYLTDEADEVILEELMNAQVAQYHYVSEDQNNPLRLGLIAEEAPEQVLALGGKGVDIYKLATFNLAGTKALAKRLQSLESRVSLLEANAESITPSGGETFSTSTLLSALQSVGVMVQQGFAQFGKLAFKELVATRDESGTSSAGSAMILAGNVATQVTNTLVKADSKIFVTFTTPVSGQWYVTDRQDGSFRVVLQEVQAEDTSFDYFFVQVQDVQNGEGAGNAGGNEGGDTTAPTFVLLGDNPVYVALGDVYTDQGVLVSDDVDASVGYVARIGDVDVTNTPFIASTAGTLTVTYYSQDIAGNVGSIERTVIVGNGASGGGSSEEGDTVVPTIELIGEPIIELSLGATFTDEGATATDNVDGDITSSIQVSGSVDVNTEGLYTITYSVEDSSGNSAEIFRTVSVVSN